MTTTSRAGPVVVTSCVVVVVVTGVGSAAQPTKPTSVSIDKYDLVFMFSSVYGFVLRQPFGFVSG